MGINSEDYINKIIPDLNWIDYLENEYYTNQKYTNEKYNALVKFINVNRNQTINTGMYRCLISYERGSVSSVTPSNFVYKYEFINNDKKYMVLVSDDDSYFKKPIVLDIVASDSNDNLMLCINL